MEEKSRNLSNQDKYFNVIILSLLVVVVVFVVVCETGFPSSYGTSPGTCSVDQIGLKLTKILLPLSP